MNKKHTLLIFMLLTGLFTHGFFAKDTRAASMTNYCQLPTFVSNSLPPNVLIIMDNAQSMDENVFDTAVGSFDPNSKTVLGKQALYNPTGLPLVNGAPYYGLVPTYGSLMNIGIATYSLPGVNYYWLSASPYFVSYQPKSYCGPIPANDITTVPTCINYCQTGTAAALTACNQACQAYNPSFDGTYMDKNISLPPNVATGGYPIGSALRNNYCSLDYPKTLAIPNVTDPGNYMYTEHNSAMYSPWNPGANWFCYAQGYIWNQELVVGQWGVFNYACWSNKVGQSDGYNVGDPGYFGGNVYNGPFGPTDSDIANGFGNFGLITNSIYTGPTWFANSSPGGGYLKVPIAQSTPAQITSLETVLATSGAAPNNGDCAGTTAPAACNFYMSCGGGNPNACSYIVNAGLSPTPGTILMATNYFNGTLNQGGPIASPILNPCAKNFIIFITDGMPDTDENGNPGTSASLMPDVLTKIGNLRCPTLNVGDPTCKFTHTIGATTYPYDIQTYVLGVGLSPFDQNTLDQVAVAGGTAMDNVNNPGHAFYVNTPGDFVTALTDIFNAIVNKVQSGTAASVLSSNEGSGSNLLQASFYPQRLYPGNTNAISWIGGLQNLWYYLDPNFAQSSIREDTVHDYKLNLEQDYIVQFYFDTLDQETMAARYQDVNGNGSSLVSENTPTLGFSQIQNVWDAGMLLWQRNLTNNPRTIYTTIDSANLMPFSLPNAATLATYLNTTSTTTAQNIINYTTGTDLLPASTYRSRTVSIGTGTNVWKLGDILNSTPKISSWVPLNNQYWTLYGDTTYNLFTKTASYAGRGAVFAGANDGMFHAFKLGTLQLQWSGQGQFDKAQLINPDTGVLCTPTDAIPCGSEMWAFIPQNALPYLQYTSSPGYCHVYTVDLAPFLFDASIAKPASCTQTNYWNCAKDQTSWRTIVIGGMRLGGACRDLLATCTSVDGSGNPDCVQTPATGQGYSSYFALDVTNQNNPILLWEFSNPQLGFASTGPAVVRISATDPVTGTSLPNDNGRWFVVFGSGPTGPINTVSNQFMGYSDQDLRFFVLDLPTGQLLTTIDTGIQYAFAGSMYNSTHDAGYANPQMMYQDSVIYVPYTMRTANSPYTWTVGGVGRLVTKLSLDPTQWVWSNVIGGLGPITASVQHVDDTTNGNMWLFFGEGRYFYAQNANVDDPNSTGSATGQRRLFGIKEPCATLVSGSPSNYFVIDPNKAGACQTGVNVGSLTDVTSIIPLCTTTNGSGFTGWSINLDAAGQYTYTGQTFNFGAERVITDPVASVNGLVFYTTFKPYINECFVGGQSTVWAVDYCNGGPGGSLLQGQVLAEVSTGAIAQINLSTAMTGAGGRSSALLTPGAPPTGQGMALFLTAPPAKRVLQMRER